MSACTLPEKTQAEVLDRPDYSSLIRGAGREEAMRDLLTSPAIETDDEWQVRHHHSDVEETTHRHFDAYIIWWSGELRELQFTKAGTHHLGFFD